MTNTKVLLLNLPWDESGRQGVRAGSRWPHLKDKPENEYLPFPFFLAYATSLLREKGISVKLCDAIAEKYSQEDTAAFIEKCNPQYLIVETSTITLQSDLTFIRKLNNHYTIILVGPDPHIGTKEFLEKYQEIDFVIRGEYEFSLLELIQTIEKKGELSKVNGILYRDNEKVIYTPDRAICNLDDLPWPDRGSVPLMQYNDTPGAIPMPSVQMLASRGCPFGCIFCLWPSIMYAGRNYRVRDYIDVVDEMEYLASQGFKSIYFDDDSFGLNREWVLSFCDEIISRNREGRINIPWAMMTRADCLDREMLFKMREAGLAAVKYGVETASPELLKNAGKEYNREKLESIIGQTKEMGIKVHLTFTFGLPGENRRSANDTIFYSFHLSPDSVQYSVATPFPGTPFFNQMKRQGMLVSDEFHKYDGNYHSVVKTDSLSPEQIVWYKNKAYHLWGIFSRFRGMHPIIFCFAKLYCYVRILDVLRILGHILRFFKWRVINRGRAFRLQNSFMTTYIFKPLGRLVRYAGVIHGERAFVGPSLIQIDPTNDCNNNCIGCWCNSPLLEDKKLSDDEKKVHLPFSTVQKIIDDAYAMKTREIYLAGSGEPFMYPYIMNTIRYIKKKQMMLYINTNFTLLDVKKIQQVVYEGVEHLTVSIWAGTPSTYVKTHPNKTVETFIRLENMLKYLQSIKRPGQPPYVKIYNVISNLNYHELDYMYDFALRTKSESIEFTVLDTIPGKTECLMLNDTQLGELREAAKSLQMRVSKLKTNKQNPPLLFRYEQFLRRISDDYSLEGEYDRNIIDKVPCTVGWTFSRIIPNGDVHGCLKAHRIPVGNVHRESFYHIWHSPAQRYFRRKTHVSKKEGTFFSYIGNDPQAAIGCYKGCDDLGRNQHIYDHMQALPKVIKMGLRFYVRLYKILAYIKSHKWKEKQSYKINTKEARELREKAIHETIVDPELRGIAHGYKAYKGPTHVVIDITNKCNNSCIGCWTYSPLIKDKKTHAQWAKQELDTKTIMCLLDQLKSLNTEIVRFTGGGEPLIHPDINKIISYAKDKGFRTCLTTALPQISAEVYNSLARLDELTVSIWAGDAETYHTLHPNQKRDHFAYVKKTLQKLARLNSQDITLSYVLTKTNYKTIDRMISFANEVGIRHVYFTLVDTIDGQTDSLLIQEEERVWLLEYFEKSNKKRTGLIIENRDVFLGRLRDAEGVKTGNYDAAHIDDIPCYIGWHFARILANGDVVPCCRAVNKVIGNIKKERFQDIWNGMQQQEFRQKALKQSKFHHYFEDVACYKTCDNMIHNHLIHTRWIQHGWGGKA